MDINRIDNAIIEVLNQKNRISSPVGLFHGDMGICLALYMANKRNPSEEKEKMADELLDSVINRLKTVVDPSFENGLSGIGFAVNFLHKEKCIDGNIDDILYQIDAAIFRYVNNDEVKMSPHLNGLVGFLIYIVERLNNLGHCKDSFLHELNINLLRSIIDRLFLDIPKGLKTLNEDMFPTLLWDFPILFYYMGEALKTNIYNTKISNMIRTLEIYICSIIPYYNLNKVLMANSLYSLNLGLNNENIRKHIDLLINAVDFSHISDEIDRGLNCFYGGWCNALINLTIASQYIGNKTILSQIKKQRMLVSKYGEESIDDILQKNENVAIDMAEGLSGLSLTYSVLPKMFLV